MRKDSTEEAWSLSHWLRFIILSSPLSLTRSARWHAKREDQEAHQGKRGKVKKPGQPAVQLPVLPCDQVEGCLNLIRSNENPHR